MKQLFESLLKFIFFMEYCGGLWMIFKKENGMNEYGFEFKWELI